MTTGRGNLEQPGDLATRGWREVRADADIQFQPLPPQPAPEPPAWLKALQDWGEAIFAPIGRALVNGWPVLKWVLLAVAVAAAIALLWKFLAPYLQRQHGSDEETQNWAPDRSDALALLDDADRLAAAGDYGAAIHLLLRRSVGQIALASPDLVRPSSTARELADQPHLPAPARSAFAVIAQAVERNLFALQALGQGDWHRARQAYADFALQRLG